MTTTADGDQSAIQVRGLRKAYGTKVAVDGLDISVKGGEVFALLGPNGAGKTTTVEILEGFRRRDAGEVEVLGRDPAHADAAWRSRMGIVLQGTGEFDELRVDEVVTLFAGYYPRADDPQAVIERVGLADKRRALTHTLSGGQKRRLDVALGIVGRPELLFLDEPTTGFDPEARRDFWDLIRELARGGTTILLTTHYLHEAEVLADRVGVIAQGRLVAAAPPGELGDRAHSRATVAPTAARTAEVTPLVTLGLRQGVIEIKQFLRTREAVVFTMLFPIILIVIFGSIFKGRIAPDVRFTQYFVTGMIASGLVSVGFQGLAIQIPIERDRGVLKRLYGTPMPRPVYFLGKVVMVLAIGVVETVLLLVVAVAFYGVHLPRTAEKWLTFGWVSLLGIAACTLCGIAFSSVARTGRSAPAVVTPVALVLQFISGVFFVYTELPGWMQQVAAVFPLKWMCQGMRSVFLPDTFARREIAGSWELDRVALILAAWCVGGLILCLTTFRWTTKRDG